MKTKKDILILIRMFFLALFLPLIIILVKNSQDGKIWASEVSTSQVSFKVAFVGVKPSSTCLTSLNKIKTEVVNKSTNTFQSDISAPLIPISNETNNDGDQVFLISNLILDSKFNNLNTFNYLRVKGSFHLASKMCLNNQKEKKDEVTACDINLANTNTTIYDFSDYALIPGDLNQDGVINTLDFSIIKSNFNASTDIKCGKTGDINLDGIVNSLDATLLKKYLTYKEEARTVNTNPIINTPTITSTSTPTLTPELTIKPNNTATPTKTPTSTSTPTLTPELTIKPNNTATPTKTQTPTSPHINLINNIQIRPSPLTLETNKSWKVQILTVPEGLVSDHIWKSSNGNIATININGLVKGKSVGEAKISAKVKGVNITSSINVLVKNTNNPVINPTINLTITPTRIPTPTVVPTRQPTSRPTPTPTKTPTEVSGNLTRQQMIDIEAGTLKLTYELFGASGNGEKDDSSEIRAAHDYANKLYAEKDKLITVYGTEGKKYKIGALIEPILVITNVDWRNATLIFADSGLSDSQLQKKVFKISTPFYYKTGKEFISIKDDASIVLNKNTTKFTKAIDLINSYATTSEEYIEFKKCNNYYVEGENSKLEQYNRYGYSSSRPQFDSFKIDNLGNIKNDIIWDFGSVTTLKVYPIYNNQISIKNADIESIVKNGTDFYIQRSIGVNRSNTLIKNIDHTLLGETSAGSKYGGILAISLVSDIVVDEFKFSPHLGNGTYDLNIFRAINLTFNNCNVYKLTDTAPWGVWGGNYQKDIVVNNSKFNRIDAHAGIWNLTVNNSTLGTYGITVVGGGLLKVTNTKFEKSRGIGLRTDYGSTWNGTIELNKVTFNPSSSTAYLIKGSVPANFDFGYDTYFPKVTINDLTITGTSDVYLFGYTQGSKYNPYTFRGDMTLTNIKSTNGIGIFDSDFTSKYLKKSSHNNQTVINISLTDVKLNQKTDIAQCKTLETSCKFKFSISE